MKRDIPDHLRNLDFRDFTDAEILEHFNYRCQICGSTWGVGLHHLVFRSQGGLNGPRIPLCSNCHTGPNTAGKKSIHGDGDFRAKWELKLFKIAETYYILRTQTSLF